MSRSFYEGLPRKRMATGVLFFNESDEVLLVKPSYKDHWTLPGGVINKNESPRLAGVREVREEVGLVVIDLRMLVCDYMPDSVEKDENLQFIFFGGRLNKGEIDKIKLQPGELEAYNFFTLNEALKHLNPKMQKRLPQALEAYKNQTMYYLENGIRI